MTLVQIKSLFREERFDEALTSLEELLAVVKDCPHLWNFRGDLLQLAESGIRFPLAESAESYKQALVLDESNLEALESLAYFYDVIDPKPLIAKDYAERYIRLVKPRLSRLEKMVRELISDHEEER